MLFANLWVQTLSGDVKGIVKNIACIEAKLHSSVILDNKMAMIDSQTSLTCIQVYLIKEVTSDPYLGESILTQSL